jgi:glycosyltransferase involved in cell wall biosynthesis
VRDLIATADALVCSSRHEPLGNVIIEGWAQGKPVIATESDGPVHLIEHGENGLLSPIDKPSLLASSIKAVLFDPQTAQALALSGQATFETKFAKSKVISQYRDFFSQITA